MKPMTRREKTQNDGDSTDILVRSALEEAAAFLRRRTVAPRGDDTIPVKYRELISVAVALATQCADCVQAHIKNAADAGATREEIAEALFIAAVKCGRC